jgi:hypothetical protein
MGAPNIDEFVPPGSVIKVDSPSSRREREREREIFTFV